MRALSDQVLVVTGGSSGIGRATALAAARCGARIAVAARGAQALESTAREIASVGGEAHVVSVDVADAAAVDAFADAVVSRWGRIDTWINAAATSVYGEFAEVPAAQFERVIAVDVVGVANGCRAAIRQMRVQEEGGAIVNISSGLGDRSVPLQSAYCAAKHAVNGLSESIRMELEHNGLPIRLTVVKPASIDTPFFDHAASVMDAEPAPVPPVYDPSVVANAILHAAEHPARDLPVGGASAALGVLELLAPRLLDRQLRIFGYPLQKGDTIGRDRSGNLWRGTVGDGSVRGGRSGRRFSVYTLLRTNTGLRRAAITGAALVGLAAGRRA